MSGSQQTQPDVLTLLFQRQRLLTAAMKTRIFFFSLVYGAFAFGVSTQAQKRSLDTVQTRCQELIASIEADLKALGESLEELARMTAEVAAEHAGIQEASTGTAFTVQWPRLPKLVTKPKVYPLRCLGTEQQRNLAKGLPERVQLTPALRTLIREKTLLLKLSQRALEKLVGEAPDSLRPYFLALGSSRSFIDRVLLIRVMHVLEVPPVEWLPLLAEFGG